MSSTIVAPSILSADFAHLQDDITKIEKAGADWIHCDIMDGHFVPNISYGPMIVKQVSKMTALPLDVHLMITDPIRYVEEFAKAGAEYITVHANACEDLEATIDKIHSLGCKVGVAVNPDFDIELFTPFIEKIELTLIMSVFAGFGGQKFIPDVMRKVETLKTIRDEKALDFLIEVDGGVNGETAKICKNAGADVLVAGSYLFGSENYEERVKSLR